MIDPAHDWPLRLARRSFLGRASAGLGALALASIADPKVMLGGDSVEREEGSRWPGTIRPLHVPPKAKRVIFLCMAGGPSQFETFDNKPQLAKLDGQPLPESLSRGQPIAQLQGQKLVCWAPQYPFQRFGSSGQEITTLFPHIGSIADEICIIRSMQTDQINHDPAQTVLNTGTAISGRPSMGSWITYGIGSESQDLPGFIVLTSDGKRSPQPINTRQWHSGFLPSQLQGVKLNSRGEPVNYLGNPHGIDVARQADAIGAVSRLDRLNNLKVDDPEVETRLSQYELAFRMQMSVPKLVDMSDEPKRVLDLYGTQGADGTFAANCLLARRLAERGVRFIQLYHRGWDHHNDLRMFMEESAAKVDQASAALIIDLKQRGMLDDTLVIWAGEFGRTPMAQAGKGATLGRDHHIRAYSIWMAGAGIRGGITHGATDELGYNAVDNIVHVHDLHATMLHLLGIDHKRLTFRFQGRSFRLTDVSGEIVQPILI